MNNLRQAAQQALEALERINAIHYLQDLYEALDWEIDALRAALAEPQTTHWEGCEAVHPECKATPRKPLTDGEIQSIWAKTFEMGSSANTFARAIERKHGIGEQHE